MRTIVIANSKGGSGKSTIATNLASYFACWGVRVTLVDFDRQGSVTDWVRARPPERPAIEAVEAVDMTFRVPPGTDYAIVDVPAGIHGEMLGRVLERADEVIVPVLPSPMDMRATARFMVDLVNQARRHGASPRICAVANRVRTQTRSYRALERFLARLSIPFIARLRDTQHYVQAAETGLGVFELGTTRTSADLTQWQPLVAWISADERLTTVPPIA